MPPIKRTEQQINVVLASTIPNRPAYRSNLEETKELQRQVEELMSTRYIWESMSLCVVLVLLVPKNNSTWRMCVDCRAIINITIKYRLIIHGLNDMFNELHGCCLFSRIDLKNRYHHIRMKEWDEWKTTFKTKDDFVWVVSHVFWIYIAPSTFMRLMNHILRTFIGRFVAI